MVHLVGDKNVFAIEFKILDFTPGLNSNVSIWINSSQIGDFKEPSSPSSSR